MFTYEQAVACITAHTPLPRIVRLGIGEALGLVLARPVVARSDLPPCDNSAVDGYALPAPAGRQAAGPETLRIVGESRAGRPYPGGLRAGEAVRILTGAVVPRGAASVVMQEQVERRGEHLRVIRWPPPGQHIRRRGEDVPKGTRVLDPGVRLGPEPIGLLAALGVAHVPVYPAPTVAIVVTGDELQPAGVPLAPGHIYESNGALLGALVQQAGARGLRLGVARDALRSLVGQITAGLSADVLLIAGGVSVGDHDLVREALAACRVRPLFWRVDIKPGMPCCFGTRGRTLVFGLPGNPVSVFVTFEEFVKPALSRLMGRPWQDGYVTPARLARELTVSRTRRTHFLRVRCAADRGELVVQPLNGQGSHQLRSLAEADGWIRVTADEGPWPAGTRVLVKRRVA